MSYSADEMFGFNKIDDKCVYLWKYFKRDDPAVEEIEIPAEYDGLPVVEISEAAFRGSKYLRRVYIPDSVNSIEAWAFYDCPQLRSIRLPQQAVIDFDAFLDCPRLDPEVVLAGLVGSSNILSTPLYAADEDDLNEDDLKTLLRPDVFELAIKYDSFREIDTKWLFEKLVSRGLIPHFEMLEKAGKSPNIEETDALINLSAENGKTEMTAYLLEYKRQKFGFEGGSGFEL